MSLDEAHESGRGKLPSAPSDRTHQHGPLYTGENLMLGLGDPEVEGCPSRMADGAERV